VTFFDSSLITTPQHSVFFIVFVNGRKGDHNKTIDKPSRSFEVILYSSGLLCSVGTYVCSYVSEEHVASVFRVNELGSSGCCIESP
jgi:hypothetical protein